MPGCQGLQCSLEVLWTENLLLRSPGSQLFSLGKAGISQRLPHPSGRDAGKRSFLPRAARRKARQGSQRIKKRTETAPGLPGAGSQPSALPLRLRRLGSVAVSLSVSLSVSVPRKQPPGHGCDRPAPLRPPRARSCPAGLGFPPVPVPVPAPVTLPVPTGPAEPCGAGHAALGHGSLADPRALPGHGTAAGSGPEGPTGIIGAAPCPCTASTMEPAPELKRCVALGREGDGASPPAVCVSQMGVWEVGGAADVPVSWEGWGLRGRSLAPPQPKFRDNVVYEF